MAASILATARSMSFNKKGSCNSSNEGRKNFFASSKFEIPRCTRIFESVLSIDKSSESWCTVIGLGSDFKVQRIANFYCS